MIDLEINENNLSAFLNDIRISDKKELISSLGVDFQKEFINTCLKITGTYFLADDDKKPIAIGGAHLVENCAKKTSQVWLLCANNALKHKIALYKYVKNKIEIFKKQNDFLFNYIYKTNFDALKWLKKCGFKSLDLKNPDYKFFYFDGLIEERNFDI